MRLPAKVPTVPIRFHRGIRADVAGPAIAAVLENRGFEIVGCKRVPDGLHHVMCALRDMCTESKVS
jgi:molybdopterin biosynthesis enzyme MoaB